MVAICGIFISNILTAYSDFQPARPGAIEKNIVFTEAIGFSIHCFRYIILHKPILALKKEPGKVVLCFPEGLCGIEQKNLFPMLHQLQDQSGGS